MQSRDNALKIYVTVQKSSVFTTILTFFHHIRKHPTLVYFFPPVVGVIIIFHTYKNSKEYYCDISKGDFTLLLTLRELFR